VTRSVRLAAALLVLVPGFGEAQAQGRVRMAVLPAEEIAAPERVLNRPARLRLHHGTLASALLDLNRFSGVPVAFSPSRLPADARVSCDCERVTVREALQHILRGTQLEFMEMEGQVVVFTRGRSTLETDLERRVASVRSSQSSLVPPGVTSMRLRNALLFLPMAAAVPIGAQQVNGRIVGRVTQAESGAPIAEAQVFVPGTGLGGLTRQNGAFVILEVPAGPQVVRAERIGLAPASQQVTVVGGQAVEVNFQMTTQALGLDEIVVTGTAGASRRREIGNSITQLSVSQSSSKPAAAAEFLQASAPGIQVSRADGGLGQGYNIRLRGNRTVSMTNQPIIYVDGVRMQSKPFPVGNSALAAQANAGSANISSNPLNDINPSDIERIEVIKGSAATTLYGTEASSGVIQVFTKRGASGAPVWNFEASMDRARAIKFGTDEHPYLRMEPFMKTGWLGNYSTSVRGGGQALQYFTSMAFEKGTGTLPNDSISKVAGRGNFTFTPAKNLNLQWNNGFTLQNTRNAPIGGNVYGITLNAYRGVANYMPVDRRDRPEVLMELFNQELTLRIQRFQSGGTLTYSPLANLTNRLTLGYDGATQETRNVIPFGFSLFPQGQVWNDTWQNRLITMDYVGTFSFDVIGGVRSSFSWGGQAVGEEELRLNGYGENFPGAANPTINSSAVKVAEEDRSKIWNAGFFLQNVFDISNRYFVTVGMRVDGNSAFGSGFGLQMYPKASAAWVISDEGFWNEGWGALKLRTAYGEAGRAPGAFDATRTWSAVGWDNKSALIPRNLGSADLGPEVTAEFEAGFDAEWLDGRLTSTFTYYDQITRDGLFNVQQIPTTGFAGTQRQNVGKLKNSGIELGVNGSPIRAENWGLDLGLNVTTNHSKVVDLGGIPPFTVGGSGWVEEGYPVPALRTRWVRNGEQVTGRDPIQCTAAAAVADPTLPCIDNNYIHGPTQPTLNVGPSVSLRAPGGVNVSARGEFRGGHFMQEGVTAGGVSRSAWMSICWPYYVSPYEGSKTNYAGPTPQNNFTLKAETPSLYRAICSPALSNSGYTTTPADFFVLRSVSVQVPLDFAFPDRVSNASLSISLNNAWYKFNDQWRILTPEAGVSSALIQQPGLGAPPTYSWNFSLKAQL
jgi:outer membrane receptor protein involved in Fe transport